MTTCNGCGDEFEAKRSDARFCSTRCRVAAHRRREAVSNQRQEFLLWCEGTMDSLRALADLRQFETMTARDRKVMARVLREVAAEIEPR